MFMEQYVAFCLMNLLNYQPSWIDLAFVGIIIIGMVRGRKRGMSEELMDVIKWLLIIAAGAFLYAPLGRFVCDMSPFSLLSCYVGVYAALIGVAFGFTCLIKRAVGDKLIGSDVFGSGEYYLGMVAGAFRHACILIVFMAIMNARHYTPQEIAQRNKTQMDNFGMTFYSMYQFQGELFGKSIFGKLTREKLSLLLIRPTAPQDKPLGGGKSRSVRARESSLQDILD